ncbi:hypothetical protein [Luteitalea sp.]
MAISWWLEVGLGLFALAWLVGVIGVFMHVVEWRRFRTSHPAAASRGLVLTKCIATTRGASAERLVGVGGTRSTGHGILLFPLRLPYASSSSFSVFWFGRAVVERERVSIVARVPRGLVMFVSGWFVGAIVMTAMLVAAGAPIIALAAIGVTTVGACGYRKNFRRERKAAERFVATLARRFENAA